MTPPAAPGPLPLRLLRVVAAVADRRSASAAAPVLHLSTSAVTRAVQQAAARLGVALVSTLQIRAELDSGLLALLPVRVQGTERAIGVAQRRGGLASPAAATLLQQLRAVAGEAVAAS